VSLIKPQPTTGTPSHGSPKLTDLPITFRLPKVGGRDPYFGLSRAWYYKAELDGRITLIRLCEKGKKRGTTLIPSSQVLALLGGAAAI
jgi:hypothetical protein